MKKRIYNVYILVLLVDTTIVHLNSSKVPFSVNKKTITKFELSSIQNSLNTCIRTRFRPLYTERKRYKR